MRLQSSCPLCPRVGSEGTQAEQKSMAKPPRPPKTDEQREAERRRREFADKLELIVENLGEDDFVSAVKGYKPDITTEELQEWIMRFRAAVREKRGLY
jgi:hypothetical protein